MRKTILACLAAVMVVGATSATAATLITSSQIKDGTIQNRDIKKGAVSLNRLTDGTQNLIRRGSSLSTQAASSQPGAKGDTGAAGAAGAKGDKGDQGPQGPRGSNGTNGSNGADGDDGVNPAEAILESGDEGWTLAGTPGASLANGELTLPAGRDTSTIFGGIGIAKAFDNVPLGDLTALVYSYRVQNRPAGSKVAPAIHVSVVGANRTDGAASGFTNLVFEPTYTQDGLPFGRVNARGGKWWSTRGITNAPTTDTYVSLDEIIAGNPGARIISISVDNANSTDMSGGADDLLLGIEDENTRYDFGG